MTLRRALAAACALGSLVPAAATDYDVDDDPEMHINEVDSTDDIYERVKMLAEEDGDSGAGSASDEWEELMDGFDPNTMVTVELAGSESITFHEVFKTSELWRGGIVTDNAQQTISVQLTDDAGKVLYQKDATQDALFAIVARSDVPQDLTTPPAPAEYTVQITNDSGDTSFVGVFLGRGSRSRLLVEHVDDLAKDISAVERLVRDAQSESTFLWMRKKNQLKTMESVGSRVYWLHLVLMLFLVIVGGTQVHYVTSLLHGDTKFW